MKWKHPPIIKIYEALGSVADDRLEVKGDTAKVYSSSGNKFYDVVYNFENRTIMSNDNGSYWVGYLGYPSIALLFKLGVLEYKPEMGKLLKDIKWKDINQKLKNNFDKTLKYIEKSLTSEQKKELTQYINEIDEEIKKLNLGKLGKRTTPPKGY